MNINTRLFRLYRFNNRFLRSRILDLVYILEQGEFYSPTLRAIFQEYYDISIGMYSYGGCFSPKNIARGTVIGRYCSFAANVSVFNGNHPIHHMSLHPFFYNPTFGYVKRDVISRTKIRFGNDIWVGANAIILPSVSKVGDGAVIGAGSVVTKDVPSFAIVHGNPAKTVKYRFSEETIRRITESAWWDKDISELANDLPSFLHPVEEAISVP